MELGESNRQIKGPNREIEEKEAFLSLDFTWIFLIQVNFPIKRTEREWQEIVQLPFCVALFV